MFRTVVTTLGLMLAACSVGEVEGGGGVDAPVDNSPNAVSFRSMIQPMVDGRCTGSTGCHQLGGTQPSPILNNYAQLQAKYKQKPGANNILVNHVPTGTMHQTATWWSATEQTTVGTWIDNLQPE